MQSKHTYTQFAGIQVEDVDSYVDSASGQVKTNHLPIRARFESMNITRQALGSNLKLKENSSDSDLDQQSTTESTKNCEQQSQVAVDQDSNSGNSTISHGGIQQASLQFGGKNNFLSDYEIDGNSFQMNGKSQALDTKCYENSFKNVLYRNQRTEQNHGIVISGHRGGFESTNSAQNTIQAFRRAIDIGLQSIELDIWMTKDNKLVIIHGGDNGEMPVPVDQKENPDYVKQYIFDLTYEELQNLFTKSSSYLDSDKTQDCLVPEMHELFSLVNNHTNHSNHFRSKQIVQDEINPDSGKFNRKVLMNLEMKVPCDADVKISYNWREAVKLLHKLIQDMDMVQYCMVQNFDHEALVAFEKENGLYVHKLPKEDQKDAILPTIYLQNFWHTWKCSDIKTMTKKQGFGTHMQILDLLENPEIVKQMHDAGKMVAVWVDASIPEVYKEDEEFYKKIYDLGIDMFTTDHCLEAHRIITEYHKQKIQEAKRIQSQQAKQCKQSNSY